MSLSIQTNVNSVVAQENLRANSNFQSRTIQRLTSGYRINLGGDDAAGLAIANKFRSDVSELSQGVRNGNDGVSTLQIADGAMTNIGQMLDRAKTLATAAASEEFTGDRAQLNSEFQHLSEEIDRQAQASGMNAGGSVAKELKVFVGGNSPNGSLSVDLSKSAVDTQSLGLTKTVEGKQTRIDIGSEESAAAAVAALSQAVTTLGSAQTAVGKGQNQLAYATTLAQSQITNVSSAESRIRDSDMATESANLSKSQILQQSSVAALAQANSAPQAVMALLRG
jgi:flagellin